MNEDIMVSIVCATYNHVNYIRQCLDSFLMQKTNSAYEILIHDDASTDGTSDIIKEYEKEYPNIIKPIYQVENQYSKGLSPTMVYNFPRAKGKYIAMCEGDDYWTDPLKLQKQVDILENDDAYGCVYTGYKTVDKNSIDCYFAPSMHHQLRSFTGDIFSSLIYGNFPQTLTILFRRSLLDILLLPPVEVDYSLFMKCALQKDFYFIPSITGAYRINPNGMIQTGDFFRLDIKGLATYYYIQYLKNKQFRRSWIPSLKIHKAFFVVLCTYSNFKNNFIYFKQIVRYNWIIGLLIPIGITRNLFVGKLHSFIRL